MSFTSILKHWYKANKRDLPWRRTTDPYKIWVSEIIMQQTRIEQGQEYYLRFLKKFPDIMALAAAGEEEVLKLWQGLGYYSRARNMHATAREIMKVYNGKFPEAYDEIRKLKGIGDYTAAAIASISFNLPYPVVDGNVLRFFTRHFGLQAPIDTAEGKFAVLNMAMQHIDKKDPGNFNQAMMEFGALQCRPGIPDCKVCPFKGTCFALRNHRIAEFPVKSKKQAQRTRHFNYLFITSGRGKNKSVFLNKRTGNDIWKNLYDFPLIETNKATDLKKLMVSEEWINFFQGIKVHVSGESKTFRHVLSHQVIEAKFIRVEAPARVRLPFLKVKIGDIGEYPVPRLVEKFMEG